MIGQIIDRVKKQIILSFCYFVLFDFLLLLIDFKVVEEIPNYKLINLYLLQIGIYIVYIGGCLYSLRFTKLVALGIILVYQLLMSLSLLLYYSCYVGSIWGYEVSDAAFYDEMGRIFIDQPFSSMVNYILEFGYDISDLGYPVIVKCLYFLSYNFYINPFIAVTVFNGIIHTLSAFVLYKLARMFFEHNLSKAIMILWGMFPLSLYFNTCGRKETFFVFIIILTMFCMYKYLHKRTLLNLLLFISVLFLIAFFRLILIPFFIIGLFTYLVITSKNKLLMPCTIVLGGIILLGTYYYFKDVVDVLFSLDYSKLREGRLGEKTGSINEIALYISALIGPFPRMLYKEGSEALIIYSPATFFKLYFSLYYIYSLYYLLKTKEKMYFPIIVFIGLNMLGSVISTTSLDPRIQYVTFPFFIMFLMYGMKKLSETKYNRIYSVFYYLFISLLIVSYNIK